jgi:hypothetical protein
MPNSHHDYGEAIDVTDWRADHGPEYEGGQAYSWQERTKRLKERARQLGGFHGVLGPGDGDAGHETHLHLALEGKRDWNDQQMEWLATGRYRTGSGGYELAMPSTTAGLQQAAGAGALERVAAWEQTGGGQAAAALSQEPAAPVSSDPGDANYWKRQDMQQWAGANATLAQRVMARHGFDPAQLQQAADPGATAGVRSW